MESVPSGEIAKLPDLAIEEEEDAATIKADAERRRKVRAKMFWDVLRQHVQHGFFHSLLNTRSGATSDFLSLVDRLWTLVHRFAVSVGRPGLSLGLTSLSGQKEVAGTATQPDSTTEFVMAGWARIKAEQHALERQRARAMDTGMGSLPDKNNADADRYPDDDLGPQTAGLANSPAAQLVDDDQQNEAHRPTHSQRRGLGIEGLSLDNLPTNNITRDLMVISKGLHVQPLDEADFYTVQVHFNRGWKLLLLGLTQHESVARYMAMCALRLAIPVINDTLLDSTVREGLVRVLVNLMLSDERTENRLKAVYLLGQLGFYLGTVREHDQLLLMAVKELVKRLLQIQYEEKRKPKTDPKRFTPRTRELKIYLLHAIGKFTRSVQKQARLVEDLVVYIMHEEFDRGDTSIPVKDLNQPPKDKKGKPPKANPAIHVVGALLGILNNEMKRTDANQKYVGALFKKYVHPLMRSTNLALQTMAVQFISNWLPIINDDANLLGVETVITGLGHTRTLHVRGFSRADYDAELRALKKKARQEESRMAMRSKLLRQLLHVPGKFARLVPVPGHPGFFVDVNSSMMYTKGIAVNLPIHPKSSVTLTRPLPSIPGVPQAVTTIPPVFMDPLWAERQKPPVYRYEALERGGEVPGLPYGYTYTPAPLTDVTELLTLEASKDAAPGATGVLVPHAGSREGNIDSTESARAGRMAALRNNESVTARTPSATPWRPGSPRRPMSSSRPRRPGVVESKQIEGSASSGADGRASRGRDSLASARQRAPQMGIREHGAIPPGTARVPQKTDPTSMAFDTRRIPPGFLSVCPFPGYDPDRIDRAALPTSAIYGKSVLPGRAPVSAVVSQTKPKLGALQSGTGGDIPDGFTADRHPVLWPSRVPDLRSARNPTDFPINAPVLFDIIQPGATHLQRVMTRVTSINKEMAAVSVQREADEGDMLSVGATFNIFIRTRINPTEWISVNLEVTDDDYQDDISFGRPKPGLQGSSTNSSLASLANIREKSSSDVDPRQSVARRVSVANVVLGPGPAPSNVPVPCGFTTTGEPYFAPPINMPPSPVGYTLNGVPYFGRTASIKPPPLGVTTLGTRFYPIDGKLPTDQSSRNHLAGYDNLGHPFFIPRGCTVPPPAGFTTDGIAYYDIPSLMQHRGVMVLPRPAAARTDWPVFSDDEDEEWEDSGGTVSASGSQLSLSRSRTAARRKHAKPVDQAKLTAQLVDSLEESQPQLKQSFLKGQQRAVGTIRRVAEFKRLRGIEDVDESAELDDDPGLQDPDDIVGFLRDSDDLAYLRPNNIRVQIEPNVLEFQSVHAPVTKAAVLRYRAGRGDYGERDFFVSVEPVDVFAVKMFHLKLQGEGVMEIGVTYYPTAMKTDQVEGSLNLIDDTGKKMGTCAMIAVRKSFLKVSPTNIDAGWTLPDRRKEVTVSIENVSNVTAVVTIQLQSELDSTQAAAVAAALAASGAPATSATSASTSEAAGITATVASAARRSKEEEERKRNERVSAFVLPVRTIKLQAHEQKTLVVHFDPLKLGHFKDTIEINGPGGDLIHVKINGVAGIPIAVYPENEENSRAGAAELTRERCNFMRKFRRPDPTSRGGEKSHVALTEDDTAILKNMMSATSDQDSRKEAHTMDFGICPLEPHCRMRCLTLMNLADTPVTVGLYPHHPALTCPYLVRIAPRMAHTVEVRYEHGEGTASPAIPGNIRTVIEVICPEFQNIPLNIRAFAGQPLFFPTWDFAFFKPCRIGKEESITMNLVNESHYALQVIVDGLWIPDPNAADAKDGTVALSGERNYISSSLSVDAASPTQVMPFSTMPVSFTFHGLERGPLLQSIGLKVVKPFTANLAAAMLGKTLYFVSICIEPYVHRPGEVPDKNGIDFLRMWMSHPKRLLDEYPTGEEKMQRFDLKKSLKPYTPGATECEVTFAKDTLIFRASASGGASLQTDINLRRSQMQRILVQSTSTQGRNVVFFTSTGFSVDPRARSLQPSDADNVDVMFLPPMDANDALTTYGFAAALVDHDHTLHAVQTVGKPVSDVLVFPAPNKENTIVLDFGRVEISAQAMDVNLKHIVLCNTYGTSYSWNVKFVGKQKFSAFDAGMIMGELQTFETFAIPFRFHCDTSGTFETSAEIHIKETLDRMAKPVKLVGIILRGQTVSTSMSGLPDTLDFGSTVVYQRKRKAFTMTNNGSTDAQVTILSRPPFNVTPKSFHLSSKAQQEIQVTYTPTESRTSQIKMLAFSNHKLYLILLTGTGGTAELICEKYENKDVDFGFQREGTVGFLSLHLTNKGTLPLTLKAVTADNLDLVKLEYLTVTSTVPYEVDAGQGRTQSHVIVRRDFWSILKRKFKVFCALKQLLAGSTSVRKAKDKDRRPEGAMEQDGKPIRIFKTTDVDMNDTSLATHLPQLRPFYSYHFRLGYTSRYQARKDTNLVFHYTPITTDEDADGMAAIVKSMQVHVTGGVYRQLELYPPYHDFGLAAAETFILPDARKSAQRELVDTYGVMRETQKEGEAVLQLEVLNMSMEAQNITLQFINTEFTVNGRTWTLQAGDKITIPVEFHPPKEQVQYHGEARFIHNYGTSVIRLAGTGASADLSTEASLDFGSLKVGSIGAKTLRLHNRGLLDCRYVLEIVQAGQEFSMLSDEPFDREGVIDSGGVDELEIECNCDRILEGSAQIVIRWLRVPMGAWEELVIPLIVQVGMPVFRLQNMELDFHTTYINVNKTLTFVVTNDGNATCNWESATEFPALTVTPNGGALQPGEILYLEVTFAPQDYESLHHSLTFYTDVGTKTLMCYGVVGVPYLRIDEASMFIDFGIVGINKTHNRAVILNNTGKRHIEYEITLSNVTHDGTPVAVDDFDVFFINPTHDIIEPGASMTVTMQTMPREYNAVYSGEWVIRTRDGEQYRGRMSATGGKAIIKLAPPTIMQAAEEISSGRKTAEMSMLSTSGRTTADNETFRASTAEATKQNLQSHLDNLHEVLAGLRAAEMDMRMDAEAAAAAAGGAPPQAPDYRQRGPRPPSGEVTPSRPSTPRRRPSSATSDAGGEERQILEEQKRRGARVMDGSDMRDYPRTARTAESAGDDGLDRSRMTPESARRTPESVRRSTSSRSAGVPRHEESISAGTDAGAPSPALRYMDELSQLEDELDVTIGLRDGGDAHGTSGLGRYHPGTPRSRRGTRRSREVAIRDLLQSAGVASASSARKRSSRGTLLHEDGEAGEERPDVGNFADLSAPISDLIQGAQDIMADAALAGDSNAENILLMAASEQILEKTRGVIKAVKEQLASPWIENRDFLDGALRRLQETATIMDTLTTVPEQPDNSGSDFNMGLLKAGERSASIMLFNLPNVGNLGFDYKIVKKDAEAIVPAGYDPLTGGEAFVLDPPAGEIAPRASVNISATFHATVPGTYQQAYELISGGEVVLTFTTTAKVGAPKIEINPPVLDFGLVSRQKATSRNILVENTGTYKDLFRIEPLVAEGGGDENTVSTLPFVLSAYKGDVEPGQSMAIQVTFVAPMEGTYTQKFRVSWSKEPLLFECKGCGGGCRIKAVFLDEKDKAFGGLDWGACVVGVQYEKTIQLTNLGNVEGVIDLSHSNDCFTYEVQRDSNGDIHVGPGELVPVKIMYWPSRTDTLKEGIQIKLPEDHAMIIPLRAVSGRTDWKVEGELKLTNMPLLEIQNRTFKLTNTGDLDIPLSVALEPGDLAPIVTFRCSPPWKDHDMMKPNQTVSVDLTVAPRQAAVIEGVLIFSTDLGKGPVSNRHEFKLRAYEEQLGLDAESDISVGRIMIGETASVGRVLTNYGSSKVKFRIRLEATPETDDAEVIEPDGTRKPKKVRKRKVTPGTAEKAKDWPQTVTSWRIQGATEGVLEANQSIPFDAIFDCTDDDEDWQEAKLIIEKCSDEGANRWTEVSSFKMVGASGNPKLNVTPLEYDFHDTGVGVEKTSTILFQNDGTATVIYEIVPNWDWDGNIYFTPDAPLQGRLDPEQELKFTLCFKPDTHVAYAAEIQIKTQLDTKVLRVTGLGAEYRLYKPSFPETVDFGMVGFGSSESRKLVVANDCAYDVQVVGTAFVSEPKLNQPDPEIARSVFISPAVLQIGANRTPTDRTSEAFTIRVDAPLPLNAEGMIDAEAVTELVRKGIQAAYLRIAILGGAAHHLPIAFRWGLLELRALVRGATIKDGNRTLESDRLKTLDFGEAGIEVGATLTFLVHNPNGFAVQFTAQTTDTQFELSPAEGSISPQGLREFSCTLSPFTSFDNVPQSETYTGHAEILTTVDALAPLSIPLLGTLIDEPLPLTAPEPLAFGKVLNQRTRQMTFAFRNPVRRPISWKFHVDPQFADVFELAGPAEGTLDSRQEKKIKITFKPLMPLDYAVTGYVETDEGSFPVQLEGGGVEAAVVLDRRYADFGVVGVGHPEFREVEIKNPTTLEMRVGARTTSDAFTTDVRELRIPPGESRKVKVYFNPAKSGESTRGKISFFSLDQVLEGEEVDEEDQDWVGTGTGTDAASALDENGVPKRRRAHTPRTRPMTGRERVLDSIELEGAAGEFGFTASATDDVSGGIVWRSDVEGEEGEVGEAPVGGFDAAAPPGSRGHAIRLNYPRIPERQSVRKHFEVENVGDTVLDVGVASEDGELFQLEQGDTDDSPSRERATPSGRVSYRISPTRTQIRPNSKQSFTVTVKGLKPGDDAFNLSLKTRTLAAPRTIPLQVTAKVVGTMEMFGEGLRTFARADNSIEGMIDAKVQEKYKYGGDTDVWKILLPIVRIGPLLPSLELQQVPVLEPHVGTVSIEPFTVRPPAIPRELPPRIKKWYMNRVSMGLEQGNRGREQEPTLEMMRRQEAAEFVQPVEKKVYLEKQQRR
ncbi:hypothetical protein HDU87_006223 [Geranomyces variabilis]|uniref:HYDIN/VesB/CFA65-like Ig-like domain-containing protein n=1 Tax=Geranomyces variabilis TaxID=109894 RepID=A0AAD5TFU9_9FUNG|nr:hypothetical protein HDU87_006223 [Geranomyces variabilis]